MNHDDDQHNDSGRAGRQQTTVAGAALKNQAIPGLEDDAISALADGALQGAALDRALAHLAEDGEARACWHAYHVVGDVLRSDDLAGCAGDLDFLAKLEARLAREPALFPVVAPIEASVIPPVLRPAANEGVFRWKMVAGFASLAAVAAIGWQALQLQAPASSGALLAQSGAAPSGSAPEAAAESTPVMLRNAQLDELLSQHNRAVGGAVLQSQAHLLRNVSINEDYPR